ncbi:MAG TPA: ABC transporter ATP-binding protein [Acidimicrobiales bacterium]|nr:ABC transporter ATP-binding protein [Acidimicrobiales bacterium]
MNDYVIEAAALTKVYSNGLRAVDSLDLAVRRGCIFGLLGPNGAGKTTTAGMLTTRVAPTSGTVSICGIDTARRPAEVRRRIGVVPQENTLDRSLNVRDNLVFHGRYFGMGRRDSQRAADRLLEQFKLTERAGGDVHLLSGGMVQRLMIARAALHDPEVLFLDEPTAGLDPQSRLALWDVLQTLRSEGHTIVLTTHYMEEADLLCDEVAIIDAGRILVRGTPSELKDGGGRVEARVAVEGDADLFASVLGDDPRVAAASSVNGSSVVFSFVRDGSPLALVGAVAERTATVVTDFSVVERTLESVFVELTGRELRE